MRLYEHAYSRASDVFLVGSWTTDQHPSAKMNWNKKYQNKVWTKRTKPDTAVDNKMRRDPDRRHLLELCEPFISIHSWAVARLKGWFPAKAEFHQFGGVLVEGFQIDVELLRN